MESIENERQAALEALPFIKYLFSILEKEGKNYDSLKREVTKNEKNEVKKDATWNTFYAIVAGLLGVLNTMKDRKPPSTPDTSRMDQHASATNAPPIGLPLSSLFDKFLTIMVVPLLWLDRLGSEIESSFAVT